MHGGSMARRHELGVQRLGGWHIGLYNTVFCCSCILSCKLLGHGSDRTPTGWLELDSARRSRSRGRIGIGQPVCLLL